MRLRIAIAGLALLPHQVLAADAPEAEAEAGGLPQLDPEYYASQVFWLLITFLILYFMCARVFLPRIGGILEERRNRIADDFDQAAEFKRQAEEAEESYRRALADARARAAQIAAETRSRIDRDIAEMQADIDRELEAEIGAAETRIRETGERAAAAIREAAKETTKAVVATLIDETPSDDAVETALQRVGT